MSVFVCPCCNHETALFPPTSGGATQMAKELDLTLLAKLPQDPRLATSLDNGKDFLAENSESPLAKAFLKLADDVTKICGV